MLLSLGFTDGQSMARCKCKLHNTVWLERICVFQNVTTIYEAHLICRYSRLLDKKCFEISDRLGQIRCYCELGASWAFHSQGDRHLDGWTRYLLVGSAARGPTADRPLSKYQELRSSDLSRNQSGQQSMVWCQKFIRISELSLWILVIHLSIQLSRNPRPESGM